MGDHFREQEDFASKQGATRRSLLKGVLVGAGAEAAGVPAAAAEPAPKFDLQNWLDTADPIAVADYHAARLAKVMGQLDPMRAYCFHINADEGFAMVVGDLRNVGEC